MEIINNVKKSQFNEVKNIYADFFRSINFNNDLSENLINIYSDKKACDVFNRKKNDNYFFVLENNEIIGFINGKIFGDIGLISHVYVKKEYRNKYVLGFLFKSIMHWFKDNNIIVIEIEVNKKNNILKNIERNNWHLVRDFEDASVFQRKI